jgi:OOP family OmpA-OmpF porin
MNLKALLAVVALFATSVASAQWYGAIGTSTSAVPLKNSDVPVTGVTTSTVTKNETGTGYKLQLGYQFNRNLAIEGGYVDLGKVNATNTTTGPAGTLRGEVGSTGWNAMVVGLLPATEKLSFLGKVGTIYSTTKGDYSTTGGIVLSGPASYSKSEFNIAYGIGLQYDFNSKLAVRGELEDFVDLRAADGGSKRTISLYSIGLVAKF